MSTEVVALVAWCDLLLPDEDVAGLPSPSTRPGWSAVPPGEASATPGGAHLRVHELAVLADGTRVILRDDLGWSGWSRSYDYESGKTQKLDPWLSLTRESVQADVRNVVLPDDDSSVDEHPYEYLRELLSRHGIETTAEQLRSVPYKIEFSDRLERRLDGQSTV